MYVGSMIYIPCISPTTYGHSKVFRSFMYAKTFENEFVSLEVHDYLEGPDLEIHILQSQRGDTYKASYFSPSQK